MPVSSFESRSWQRAASSAKIISGEFWAAWIFAGEIVATCGHTHKTVNEARRCGLERQEKWRREWSGGEADIRMRSAVARG